MDRRRLIDIGLALLLAVAGTVEALVTTVVDAPWPVVAWLVLGTSVPLAWRRRPRCSCSSPSLVAVGVTDTRWHAMDELSVPFAGLLLATYASGAYTDRRDGRIAAAVIALAVVAMALSIGEDPVGDALFIGGILFAVWGAATVVRSRHELATALAARTVELEHEREEKARARRRRGARADRARAARRGRPHPQRDGRAGRARSGARWRRAPADREVLATIEQTGRAGAGRDAAAARACCAAPTTSSRSRRSRASSTSAAWSTQVREAGLPVELRVEGEVARAAAPGSTCPPTGSCRRR